ncbi:CoA-transferase subunit beta [Sphingoaurantiacus capsulatus]|uniref:CoA-transferase subunit beta n=1 Tax=Sphingoaurantiacus capsulatus TaxID=1771310 RepID=A0ABV7XFF5_9SPHN
MTDTYSLADLCIVAAAEAWRHDGEVLATGITLLPRLAASLAKLSINPALMMTDGENSFVEEPVPVGPRGVYKMKPEGWAPYARTFDNLWGGKRHAFVAPVQIDRFGQTNISVVGSHTKPKAQMLGARGFPGNSVHHQNSYFFPSHNRRAFVEGEVDFVCSAGYNRARWLDGRKPLGLDLRLIVTDLCVMDFGGPDHAIRLVSLHPGISVEQVQAATGFDIVVEGTPGTTPPPTPEQLAIIATLDPHGQRKSVFAGDPPGDRRAA